MVIQPSEKSEGSWLVLTTAGTGLDSSDSRCAQGAKNVSANEQLKHLILSLGNNRDIHVKKQLPHDFIMYVTFTQSMHSIKSNQNTIKKSFYSPCITVILTGHLLIQQNWYWFQRCCTYIDSKKKTAITIAMSRWLTMTWTLTLKDSHTGVLWQVKQYAHNAHIRDSVKQHGDLKSFTGCYFTVSSGKWATQELWMPHEHV